MAVLEKMAICGVRSYSPSDFSIIEFQAPLTLLVGANGSGKTVSQSVKLIFFGLFFVLFLMYIIFYYLFLLMLLFLINLKYCIFSYSVLLCIKCCNFQ